jgi:hypothetical protein
MCKDRISQAILFLHYKGSIQVRLTNHVLHLAISVIFEDAVQQMVEERGKCLSKNRVRPVQSLSSEFLVLLCGLSFAILIAIAEFCMKVNCENELHPATVSEGRGYTSDWILMGSDIGGYYMAREGVV